LPSQPWLAERAHAPSPLAARAAGGN